MVPDIQELAQYYHQLGLSVATEVIWQSQLGCVVLLLNMNIFTDHQYQTSLLLDCDGSRQKQDHSLIVCKQKKQERCPSHKNDQTSFFPDCSFFTNYSINIGP